MNNLDKPKTGSFVLPGDRLGVIEEFSPNEGTYDEEGEIFASNAGIVLIDKVERRVKVIPFESNPFPKKGSLAIGMIINVGKALSMVSVGRIGNKTLSSPCSGVIHVSQISNHFIADPSEAFKVGDIVKGRIIDVKNEFVQLSTIGKSLGVVLAFCSKCGSTLHPKGDSILTCNICGNKEKRKISAEYGKVKL